MTIKTSATPYQVAILGGAGFLGSILVAKLDAAGYQVKVITRRRESAKHLILLPNVQVVECSMINTYALKNALTGCDAVINLIGILHESGKQSFEAIHHQLPRRVAQWCEELAIPRLIHMSALQANSHAPSEYLRSKAAGEAAVTWPGMGANLAVVIAGNLVGGSVLVGLAYHVIYRVPQQPQ